MKKSLLALLALTTLAAVAFVCYSSGSLTTTPVGSPAPALTSSGAAEHAGASGKTFELNFASHESKQHAQGVGLAKMKEVAEELSGGRITINLFHNSSLYPQDAEMDAIISGELEMCTIEPARFVDYVPDLGLLVAPYTFVSYNHMRKVMGGEIGEEIYQRVSASNNYVMLSTWYFGSRQINTRSDKPVITPADLKGVLLRMPGTAAFQTMGESLGATVTPLAIGEVYTALQTGTIDAQDNPLSGTYTNKFYEVTKHISLTNHLLSLVCPSINADVWNEMGLELQNIMYRAAEAGREVMDAQILKEELEMIEFYRAEGLIITEPDINAFKEYSQNYYKEKSLTKAWDMDLLKRINDLI